MDRNYILRLFPVEERIPILLVRWHIYGPVQQQAQIRAVGRRWARAWEGFLLWQTLEVTFLSITGPSRPLVPILPPEYHRLSQRSQDIYWLVVQHYNQQ